MRPAWVGRAAVDVQYERGAGAMMAIEGTALSKAANLGMRCRGFPALPKNADSQIKNKCPATLEYGTLKIYKDMLW